MKNIKATQGTVDHQQKYLKIAEILGISVKKGFKEYTVEQLQEKYDADNALNNIPLGYFDRLAEYVVKQLIYYRHNKEHNLYYSLSLGACIYKTLIVHELLGITYTLE